MTTAYPYQVHVPSPHFNSGIRGGRASSAARAWSRTGWASLKEPQVASVKMGTDHACLSTCTSCETPGGCSLPCVCAIVAHTPGTQFSVDTRTCTSRLSMIQNSFAQRAASCSVAHASLAWHDVYDGDALTLLCACNTSSLHALELLCYSAEYMCERFSQV